MDDETVSGASAEDPVVVLGSGILGWTADERRTDRYGTVHLTVMDSIPGEPAPARIIPVPPGEDLKARILQELAKGNAGYADAAAAASEAAARPDNRFVAFGHAPLGTAGTLGCAAVQEAAREAGDGWIAARLPGNAAAPAGSHTVATSDASAAAPGQDRSVTPRLADGQGFPDAPCAPLPASPGRRAAGTAHSPASQSRPGRRQ